MHGDDVSDEGALLYGCDVPISNPIGQRCLWAAGYHGAGSTIGDEDRFIAKVSISSWAVGYWGDV